MKSALPGYLSFPEILIHMCTSQIGHLFYNPVYLLCLVFLISGKFCTLHCFLISLTDYSDYLSEICSVSYNLSTCFLPSISFFCCLYFHFSFSFFAYAFYLGFFGAGKSKCIYYIWHLPPKGLIHFLKIKMIFYPKQLGKKNWLIKQESQLKSRIRKKTYFKHILLNWVIQLYIY